MTDTVAGADGKHRCRWSSFAPEFDAYHDQEWGFPVADDRRLFEKLTLESFQSGLSWRTILAKREGFRAAFARFDIARVAAFDAEDQARLLADASIVRHRGKIDAAINNARRALEVVANQGSLAAYFWQFEAAGDDLPPPQSPARAAVANPLAKDLKKRGWRFVGPTTVYAFMQAAGLINDHVPGCWAHDQAVTARAAFHPPGR